MAAFIQSYPDAFLVIAGFLFTALFGAVIWFIKETFSQFRQALSNLGDKLEKGMENLGSDLRAIHQEVGEDISDLNRRLSHLEGEHSATHQGGTYQGGTAYDRS